MSVMFPQSSSNYAITIKVLLVSTSVLSAAVALKVTVPAIADFAVTDAPSIYNGIVSWLKPPYLYLVINCIIITIVASSKLQAKVDDPAPSSWTAPQVDTTSVPGSVHVQVPLHPQHVILDPTKQYKYGDFAVDDEAVEAVRSQDFGYANDTMNTELKYYEPVILGNGIVVKDSTDLATGDVPSTEPEMSSYSTAESVVVSKSSRSPTPLSRRDSSEFLDSNEKPLVSARFSHRRSVKASPEGGKTALRVSKTRKQDTLETTWKTITEGRAMPLARHLRKSDTWETHGGRHPIPGPPQSQRMTKAETFHDRSTSSNNSLRSPSPGSGKLKRAPSLSQDELNKRVEAFIKKFNEEMRLQRQESLNQYAEMINRGAY